jgi:hypothetical protein
VSPQAALAWNVFGDGKTVVRSGFGIYRDQLPAFLWGVDRFLPPFFSVEEFVFPQFLSPLNAAVTQPLDSSSQQLRDSIERDMAQDYLASQEDPVNVTAISFLFATKSPAPLSWHLTKDQIKQIGDSWLEKENQEAWRKVCENFSCSTNQDILKRAQEGGEE